MRCHLATLFSEGEPQEAGAWGDQLENDNGGPGDNRWDTLCTLARARNLVHQENNTLLGCLEMLESTR